MERHTPSARERAYDTGRRRQWLAGEARAEGVSRRRLLTVLSAAGVLAPLLTAPGAHAAPARRTAAPGIVKPLPEHLFTVRGTNAETRFEALRGTGLHTPADRFFVRNHTETPQLGTTDWSLRLWGSGLRGGPVEFGLDDLKSFRAYERSALIECAGNGRSLFTEQQGQEVTGTAWRLGAVGSGRWRGARLADVLRAAGVTEHAVDVMPRGLDPAYVDDGVDQGRVRRPLPLAKALEDVLLAYELNGEPLPYDHGHPVRVVVPGWVGISSVKWVGDIEVSDVPLYSPWNTDTYRLFGPSYPPEGSAPLAEQTLKAAFELPWQARLRGGAEQMLTGRAWSGRGGVDRVEVSTDGGKRWRPARLHDRARSAQWVRWSLPWRPQRTGDVELLARAYDTAGRVQPERTVFNEQGYLFSAVARHPVRVV
ncbi:sulfite oxidase [Streptomyces sulphureus]|uniref:sulfite oxidase n=1 Tax=Streptomyces sulphureus TaxID=47758 RepID=UPI00037A9C9F|nr:sulfite oxidase [Streptomyces sulphureus]